MLDRVRIRTLRDAGHTLREIACSVGVGKRSVRRILKEPSIVDPESAPTPRSRRIGRPSIAAIFQVAARRILKEDASRAIARWVMPSTRCLRRISSYSSTVNISWPPCLGNDSSSPHRVSPVAVAQNSMPETLSDWLNIGCAFPPLVITS